MTPEQLKCSILGQAFRGLLIKSNEKVCFQNIRMIDIEDEPYDIPKHWKWTTLGNICEMYTGNSIAESEKKLKYCGVREGYDYIATKDVSYEQKIEYDNGVKIPYGTDFKIAKQNSILMCIEGGSAGRKIAIVERDVCFGNKLCMFMPFEVYNLYLFYYLQSVEFKYQFSNNMTGIIGGVSIRKLRDLYIPLPSVNEQKEIVSQIEKLLPYVDRYKDAYTELNSYTKQFPEDMKKSILQYAMQGKLVDQRSDEGTGDELYCQIQTEKEKLIKAGTIKKERSLPEISEAEKPFDIPTSWRWVRLAEICEQKPVNGYSPKNVDYITEVKKLTLTATTAGYFKPDAFKYVDVDKDKVSKYWLKHNDLLIQRSNSRELVGTSCIYTGNDDEYIYPDLMMRVRILQSVELVYLDYALKSPATRSYFSQKATGTSSSMPKINQDIVANTLIPLPPLQEQRRIVKELKKIIPYCEKLYMRPT